MTNWKECEQCGKLFSPAKPEGRFCSRSCARVRDQLLREFSPDIRDELMCALREAVDKVLKR